jgi:DNA-binding PadR family transcriptional regulator
MAHDTGLSIQSALLGFLMMEPHHGYDLHREFSRELGQVWRVGRSKLYAQLKQLESEGLVRVELERQPNRPDRKVYHITPAGRRKFLAWVHEPTPYLRYLRVEFLARLYFFRRLPLPGLERLVEAQKAICDEQIERWREEAAASDDEFLELVLDFRRGQLEAVIEWLDRCLERA